MDTTLSNLVGFLDYQTRLLIVKDFRGFRRDPSQWAQILIFMGLVVLYFTNVRRFYQEERNQPYQNGISLMNLAATATLMCAYTGRFIYPMLSLEGRKFWILGLLPLRRERLLWGKFVFSSTWALLIAEFLVIFSDLMLGMPAVLIGIHALTVAVLALGLSGLSVGIGAWIPNFKESDPSKVAVGFGGTLNLVTSLFFLIAVIALMAIPWHLRIMTDDLQHPLIAKLVAGWLIVGMAAGIALGAAAVFIPLRIGARALRRMEF
jgi:ABC-2 type transport system permease protein